MKLLTVLAGLVAAAAARPDGAPDITPVCVDMVPNHGDNIPRTSDAPYSITLDADSYSPGDVLQGLQTCRAPI